MGGVRPDDQGYALESNIALLRLEKAGKYRWVVNGHTHNRMVRKFDKLTIINTGTLFYKHDPCFLIADFKDQFVQFYNIKHSSITNAELIPLTE